MHRTDPWRWQSSSIKKLLELHLLLPHLEGQSSLEDVTQVISGKQGCEDELESKFEAHGESICNGEIWTGQRWRLALTGSWELRQSVGPNGRDLVASS